MDKPQVGDQVTLQGWRDAYDDPNDPRQWRLVIGIDGKYIWLRNPSSDDAYFLHHPWIIRKD